MKTTYIDTGKNTGMLHIPTKDRNNELMTTQEVADMLRCKPDTVRSLVCLRKLAAIHMGNRLLFYRSDVEKFLASRYTRGRA